MAIGSLSTQTGQVKYSVPIQLLSCMNLFFKCIRIVMIGMALLVSQDFIAIKSGN